MEASPSDEMLCAVASFAAGDEGGVYVCRLDPQSGGLERLGAEHSLDRLLYLCWDDARRRLLAASVRSGEQGAVGSFSVAAGGQLSLESRQPTGGPTPCFIDVVDRWMLVANYSGGTLALLPVDDAGDLHPALCIADHRAGLAPDDERLPRPHACVVDPTGQWVLAADLGLGELRVYRLVRETGSLALNPAGTRQLGAAHGPRHLRFSPDGTRLYVIHEHDGLLDVLQWDPRGGQATAVQRLSTLPAGTDVKNHAADLRLHPSGRFVYVSHRGHDTVAVLTVDPATGRLAILEHVSAGGAYPNGLSIDPAGRLIVVANEKSDRVATLWIDQATGRLTPASGEAAVPRPVCVTFLGS